MAKLYNASEVISFFAEECTVEETFGGSDDDLEMDVDDVIDDGKYKK